MLTGYYQKNKSRLKNTCERYQYLSKEEKNKKHRYGREQYKKFPEDKKKVI